MKRKKAKRRKKNELDGIEKEENERKERKNFMPKSTNNFFTIINITTITVHVTNVFLL